MQAALSAPSRSHQRTEASQVCNWEELAILHCCSCHHGRAAAVKAAHFVMPVTPASQVTLLFAVVGKSEEELEAVCQSISNGGGVAEDCQPVENTDLRHHDNGTCSLCRQQLPAATRHILLSQMRLHAPGVQSRAA